MDIKFYIGGHRKTSVHFAAVLAENNDYLKSENIAYSPATRRTLRRISEAIDLIKAGNDIEEVQADLLERLSLGLDAKRLLIVDTKMIGSSKRSFSKSFYNPRVGSLFKNLDMLFKGHKLRLYAETRNLETLTKAAYAEGIVSGDFKDFEALLSENDLNEFRWSTFIHRIQDKDGFPPATIWRFEDYPYIWRDIVGAFTGVSNSQDLVGAPELESYGLSFQGAQLFNKYTKEYPDLNTKNINDVRDTFLRKFPDTEEESTGVYWSLDQAEAMAHSYDDDWYYIRRMQNVEVISPRVF